jgi:hypothetical protein
MIDIAPRRLDFKMRRSDTPAILFEAVKVNEAVEPPEEIPIDLTQANTEIRMTAKKKRTDAAPFFRHTFGVIGGEGGITVDDPPDADKNWGTIKLAVLDTSGLTVDTDLEYDVEIREPDGSRWTILEGLIAVIMDIGV